MIVVNHRYLFMGCLYGLALCRLEALLTGEEQGFYYSWNWLIHKLTYFVYTTFGQGDGDEDGDGVEEPNIPKYDVLNPYSVWFYRVFKQLGDEFHDVTPILTLRCLENVPEEKLAEMMYDQLPLHIQLSFFDHLGEGGLDGGKGISEMIGVEVAKIEKAVGLPILC